MTNSPISSYSAHVQTAPPRAKTFSTESDPSGALVTARHWVEDQARDFLEKHSLPQNPWDAGSIFAGEPQGSSGEPLGSLTVYTSEDAYVFEWDDEG
jgi:hypothetical protein